MPKKKESNVLVPDGDYLQSLQQTLSTQFKGDRMTFDIMSDIIDDLNPKSWISTGDPFLDLVISNREDGGLPSGKFIDIYGDSSSGKSLLVMKIIASAIKNQNANAVYYDTERSVFPEFLNVLGVDTDEIIYVKNVKALEKIFQSMVTIIQHYKKSNRKEPLIIVIDSLKATNIEEFINNLDDFKNSGYQAGAQKQKLLGESLEKILDYVKDENILFISVNQTRDNLNKVNKYQPDKRSTSGNATIFYSDVRIELKRKAWIQDANKQKIGIQVEAKTVKSRIAPPERSSSFFVYFTKGMDTYASWIENLKTMKIISGTAHGIKYVRNDGEVLKIDGKMPSMKEFKRLIRVDEEIRNELYKKVCDFMIIPYEYTTEDEFEELEDIIEITDGDEELEETSSDE